MPDYTGYDCNSFLPVETQEDWDRYQECLRQHRAVGNDPEQKGSREAFEGGQLDPNAPNYIYSGQGSGGSGSNLGTPLYNWMDINKQFPGGLGVESIPGFFDKMSSAERSLATSMAGLQELQQGEADYGRRQLSDPTNYLSLFQVNPYRGNFYAENGGFMDGSMQPSASSESMRFLTQIASETLKDTKNTAKRIKISEAYSRILSKVSNSRGSGNFVNQMGGEAEGEEFVPIQAEKGEKLIFSDGTTSPVKAKKKHSRMSDDDVTDIVPDGTYVVSDARKMALTKDEASQYSLALINEPYKLKGKVQEPKEVTLADYFGDKKKITPARLLDNIDKKHKVHDLEESERDPYIALTNDFNLIFRQETVLPAVIQASEDKSVKVNTEELAKDIMTISGIEKFKYGGKVTKKGVTQHNPALISGALEAVTGLFTGIMSSVQGKKARKDITRASDRIQKILDETYSSQTQRVDAASGASLLGIMAQNPVVASPAQTAEFQSQFSRLESLASSADSAYESARDYSVNATARNLAPMVEMAARLYGPQAGNNAMAQYSQAIADASSKAAVMATDKRMAIEQRTQEQMASLSGQAAKMNTDALNQTTQNVNAIASSAAGTIAENQLTQANLEGQKASQDIANLTWKAQGQAATRGATMQGWTNAGIMMSSGLGQMANNWPQQQVNTNTSFQNTMDAIGQSQFMNPNYQFGQGNQWQPTYGGWNNTMPQYNPSNLYGGVGMSGRTTFPGYQEMGGFASKKGISVSEMYENIRLKKKSSIGQYQEGGFADKTPPNPYPQGSEEARLWEIYTSQNLRPSDSALIASGNVRNESGFESSYEFATSGMPSEELRRVLSEIDQNKGRDRYGVETSSYTDAQGRNVEMEMSQFRGVPITNISESADSSVLTFKQGSKEGDTKYTGRFYEPSLIPEGLTFDSFGKAEAFVSSPVSNVQGNGEIPVLEVNRKGGKYTVTQHRKVISNVLPSSGKARSAEELAFLKSMGLDPKDEITLSTAKSKDSIVEVSDELAKKLTGGKRYFNVEGGELVEVTDEDMKRLIESMETAEVRDFGGSQPLLSLSRNVRQ